MNQLNNTPSVTNTYRNEQIPWCTLLIPVEHATESERQRQIHRSLCRKADEFFNCLYRRQVAARTTSGFTCKTVKARLVMSFSTCATENVHFLHVKMHGEEPEHG